jgi:hypothetical protein
MYAHLSCEYSVSGLYRCFQFILLFTCKREYVCVEINVHVQKAHSGLSGPKLQPTTALYVTQDGFKYLCAHDGSVHNSFDMNVTYGTLSAAADEQI